MPEPADRLNSALVDRYRIERELGAGGMATVYLAEDVRHRRRVALKVLHPELSAILGPERFLKEIELTASLQHPHILPLFDSGSADGQLFYVMPFVEGETLRARLEREKQLPISDALLIAREVADALQYAHDRGIIHRDIKPENILLQGGHALVADFGIALAVQQAGGQRMTQTGLSLGTPQYMAPEQAMGEKHVDGRADIYALGAVLYEMLAGEPPFTGPTAQAIVAKVLTEKPASPSAAREAVPAPVERAVLRALAKLPADRFQVVRAFAEALAAPDDRVATVERERTKPRARWMAMALPAVTLALGVAIGAFAAGGRGETAIAGAIRPLRITHSGQVGCAAISPDGREFAAITGGFSDETQCVGTLVVRAMPNGADQVRAEGLSGVQEVRWSPDGANLLFSGTMQGVEGLRVVSRAGEATRLLRHGRYQRSGFIDSRTVFIVDGQLIRMLDIESGDQRDSLRVPAGLEPLHLVAHPSRGVFAMTAQRGLRAALFLLTAGGALTDSTPDFVRYVTWLGDDRVAAVREIGIGSGEVVVYRVDAGGIRFTGPAEMVWASLPATNGLSATASGDRLMVMRIGVVDEQHMFDLTVSPLVPKRLTRSLNAYIGDPAFSPDGQRIAYAREDAVGFNLYTRPVTGGAERALTSDSVPRLRALWTGSERVIGWVDGGPIASIDVATGRVRKLGDEPPGRRLLGGWEDRLYWSQASTREVVVTDSLGKLVRAQRLPDDATAEDVSGWNVGRGEPIAFGTTDSTWRVYRLSSDAGAWTMSPTMRRGLGFRFVGTGADGSVYFTRFSEHTEIWRLPALDRPPALMASLPVHCYLGSVRVSADGKRAVCNVTTSEPDAWVLTMSAVAARSGGSK